VPFGEPFFDVLEIDRAPGALVIRVSGELHVSTAPRLREELDRILDRHRGSAVVLDLLAVSFVDSTGLSVLLGVLRRVTHDQGRMAIACSNPTVLRLFEITHLSHTIDVRDDVDAALALLREPADPGPPQAAGGRTAGAP
jgi:anti-sigma B factor antagonist